MNPQIDDIVQIKFKLGIPSIKWMSVLSKKYTHITFSILSMLPLGNNLGNIIVSIEGIGVQDVILDLKRLFSELLYTVLFNSNQSVLLNANIKDPKILKKLVKIGIPVRYPIIIKGGIASIELIAERGKLDNFLNEMEDLSLDFSIKRLGPYNKTVLLTERQKEILTKAFNMGYFEIPRRISLSNLAAEFSISPSSLSETLRRINKSLAEDYINNEYI
ncbi:MAG: helix-turn-helix domain-containing protein [Promethearchaeota archaeon]